MVTRLRPNLILVFIVSFAILWAEEGSAAQPIRIVSPASRIFAGQPVRFHIQAARLVSPQQATLYYRGIGTAVYKRLPMEQASPIDFKAVLPSAKVTPPGIQLFFVVVDGKGNTFTLPESNPQRNPHSIPIALDRSPPYVTGAWPAEGDVIQERRPRIEIAFEDAETRVHKASVRVILDDTDVTQLSEITEDRATFSPQTDLPDGSHVITVDLTDVCGNRMAPASWEFSVQGESDAQAAGDLYWDVEARRKVASPSSNVEPRWQLQSSGTLSTWMEKGPLSMTFDADAWYFDEEGPEPRDDLFTLNHFLWQAQYGKQQVQVGDVVVDGTELISPSIDRRGGHLALDIAGTRAQAFVLRSNYITGFDQGVGIGKSGQRIYGGAVERDLLDVDAEGHGSVEDPRAVQVHAQATIVSKSGSLGHVGDGHRGPVADVVGILEAKKPRAREVRVVGPNSPGDVLEAERAVSLIWDRVGHDPAQAGHAALLVQERVALVAQYDLVAAPAVGQQRHQITHGAARDEEGCLFAKPLCGLALQLVDSRIVPIDIVAHFGLVHGLAHLRGRFRHGITT